MKSKVHIFKNKFYKYYHLINIHHLSKLYCNCPKHINYIFCNSQRIVSKLSVHLRQSQENILSNPLYNCITNNYLSSLHKFYFEGQSLMHILYTLQSQSNIKYNFYSCMEYISTHYSNIRYHMINMQMVHYNGKFCIFLHMECTHWKLGNKHILKHISYRHLLSCIINIQEGIELLMFQL